MGVVNGRGERAGEGEREKGEGKGGSGRGKGRRVKGRGEGWEGGGSRGRNMSICCNTYRKVQYIIGSVLWAPVTGLLRYGHR
jgi:hypothetical protein